MNLKFIGRKVYSQTPQFEKGKFSRVISFILFLVPLIDVERASVTSNGAKETEFGIFHSFFVVLKEWLVCRKGVCPPPQKVTLRLTAQIF